MKKDKFQIPEGYFDQLEKEIMHKIAMTDTAKTPFANDLPLEKRATRKKYNLWYMGIAATFLLMVVGTYLIWQSSIIDEKLQEEQAYEELYDLYQPDTEFVSNDFYETSTYTSILYDE